MTEKEWLECSEPWPLLDELRHRARSRKSRLFAHACCQRILRLFQDKRLNRLLAMLEQFADGVISESVMETSIRDAMNVERDPEEATAPWEAYVALTSACADDAYDFTMSVNASGTQSERKRLPLNHRFGIRCKLFRASALPNSQNNAASCATSSAIPSAPSRLTPGGSHRP